MRAICQSSGVPRLPEACAPASERQTGRLPAGNRQIVRRSGLAGSTVRTPARFILEYEGGAVIVEDNNAETLASIRRGMEQAERGEGIPLAEAEERLRKKHGFSR